MAARASFSTAHIDYLQRNFLSSRVEGDASVLFRGIRSYDDVRLLQVAGLSRFWMGSEQKALAIRQLMADFFTGLQAERVPVVFLVLGTVNRVSIYIGSFRDNEVGLADRPRPGQPQPTIRPWPLSRGGVTGDIYTIAGSLHSAFPGIFLRECTREDWDYINQVIRAAPGVSLITGTPTAKLGSEHLGVEQIERLIRGMYGQHWGYMVVAKPLPPQEAIEGYNLGLSEQREVANAQSAAASSPIAEAYGELLQKYLERYDHGKSTGLWRVSAYCFGANPLSYLRARAVALAVFGGEESRPDPLRVLDCFGYALPVAFLGQLVLPCQQQPEGQVAHLYHYASVLHSGELAALAHLPQEEMPGYFVRDYARFDVSPPVGVAPRRVVVGEILDRGIQTGNHYAVTMDRLNEHGLIVGVTGSGKTNTAFHLLREAWRQGVPFLVVEPAKSEYRQLLDDTCHPGVGKTLRVFTLGDERISPFRLNPFQVLPGVPVQTHMDHLKDVFNSSFAMYGPMPQVLEECIQEIYQDRGWDMASGQNRRGEHPLAYPTLTDLYLKIDQVVGRLGYGERITPELRAALKVRVNSLRLGSKGMMLDTPLSIPIAVLLEQPTILELQAIGDDGEKAFLMGLIWVFLYEYYRATPAAGPASPLRHLTLIEEAHRLLTDVPVTVNPEIANTRGKAVESFCQMLSEIRAYGEGVLIADQIPARLAPDAVKNTSLKVVHRLVSEEDRLVMGGAMNLDEHQLRYIATLGKGDAAVYAEGDDRAYLVHVPLCKERPAEAGTGPAPNIQLAAPAGPEGIRIMGTPEMTILEGPSGGTPQVRILGPTTAATPEEKTGIPITLGETTATAPEEKAGIPITLGETTAAAPEEKAGISITLGATTAAAPEEKTGIPITLGETTAAAPERDTDPAIVVGPPAAAPTANKPELPILVDAPAGTEPAPASQSAVEPLPIRVGEATASEPLQKPSSGEGGPVPAGPSGPPEPAPPGVDSGTAGEKPSEPVFAGSPAVAAEPLRVDSAEVPPPLQVPPPSPSLSISSAETLSESDRQVQEHMAGFPQGKGLQSLFRPPLTSCPVCKGPCVHRAPARRLAGVPEVRTAFARYALTCVHDERYLRPGLQELDPLLRQHSSYIRDDRIVFRLALHLLADDHFRCLGDAYQWPYPAVERLHRLFRDALQQILPDLDSQPPVVVQPDLADFRSLYRELCRRPFDPYGLCGQVCPDGLCLYRFSLAPLVPPDADAWLHQHFQDAFKLAGPGPADTLKVEEALRQTGAAAVRRILAGEVAEQAKQRATACFLVQKAHALPGADQTQRQKAAGWSVAAVLGVKEKTQ